VDAAGVDAADEVGVDAADEDAGDGPGNSGSTMPRE